MVFGWTKQKFPFTVKSVHDLTIAEHVVAVTGKPSSMSVILSKIKDQTGEVISRGTLHGKFTR
jgi:hypothetical protein